MADVLTFRKKRRNDNVRNDSHFNTLMLQKIMNHVYLQAKNNIDKGFKGELYDLINVYCKTNKVLGCSNKNDVKKTAVLY